MGLHSHIVQTKWIHTIKPFIFKLSATRCTTQTCKQNQKWSPITTTTVNHCRDYAQPLCNQSAFRRELPGTKTTTITDRQHTKGRQTKLLGCKRFHLWSSLSNPSHLKESVRKHVKAVKEGNRQHLEMNGATRARLAQPRRTAYLRADVTEQRQPESRAQLNATRLYWTEGWRQALHSRWVINLTELHNKGWAVCMCVCVSMKEYRETGFNVSGKTTGVIRRELS